MANLFWSGPRESDIDFTDDLFEGSDTIFGSNNGKNHAFCGNSNVRINHNLSHDESLDFIRDRQLEKIKNHPDCRFMAYNPNFTFGGPQEIVNRTICLNDEQLMNLLNNKIEFRKLIGNELPLIPMEIIRGENCSYSELKSRFSGYDSFVIQEPVSSGGHGTFLMNESTFQEVVTLLVKDKDYIVTCYIENNVPVNVHAVIFEDDTVILPGSVQIIRNDDFKLLYRGADFLTFFEIDSQIRDALYEHVRKLSSIVRKLGYRGVAGVDAIISDDKIYITEINNRFQASSVLVTKALSESGYPTLQELNIRSFLGEKPDASMVKKLLKLDIPYSMYNYVHEAGGIHSRFIFGRAHKEPHVVSVLEEGYNPNQPAQSYASLFSLIIDTNITSLCDDCSGVRVSPNIVAPSKEWSDRIISGELTTLKISLINRGVVLTDKAKRYIHEHGDMCEGTYHSLDLFYRGIYINCPLRVKFTSLSPFSIDVDGSSLALRYYDYDLGHVDYDKKVLLLEKETAFGTPLDKILLFASDRVRIQNNSYCTFVKNNVACRFCEAVRINNEFTEQDILSAIDILFQSQNRPMFRHILIGGASNDIGSERGTIIKMLRRIRSYSDMPVYLMCLPPKKDDIVKYYEEGVTEFGFNIEIYDRSIARRVMPGKGSIPLRRYWDALTEAVRLCGRTGAVRTAFIVGLEPKESLMQGIEEACKIGVAPILSAFRPIHGTEMAKVIPPSDEYLYEITLEAEAICEQYHLSLGPNCPACRNNTLTCVKENEVTAMFSSLWMRDDN